MSLISAFRVVTPSRRHRRTRAGNRRRRFDPALRLNWLQAGGRLEDRVLLADAHSFVCGLAGTNPTLPPSNDNCFEIDGDLAVNGTGTNRQDWLSVIALDSNNKPIPATGITLPPATAPLPGAFVITDTNSGGGAKDANIFSPSGKFNSPDNWTISSGSVGSSQDDLTNSDAMPVFPSQSPD